MPLNVMTVHIEGPQTIRCRLELEVAIEEEDCRRGLMFREALEDAKGILIRNPYQGVMSIWMKNTAMPLDIIFVGLNWRIADLIEGASAMSEHSHSSTCEVVAAIELNVGSIRAYGLQVGDQVLRSA